MKTPSDLAALVQGLTLKRASAAELPLARELQRQVFVEHHGRLPTDAWEERAHHFIAYDRRGQLIATFRIVGPEQRPFDLEATVDLSSVLAPDRRPGVIGRLCIRRDLPNPREYLMVPAGLLKLAIEFCRARNITDLLLYTYPKLLNFYRRAFFREFAMVDHDVWGTMHVMHLDLVDLATRHAESDAALPRFLFRTSLPNLSV